MLKLTTLTFKTEDDAIFEIVELEDNKISLADFVLTLDEAIEVSTELVDMVNLIQTKSAKNLSSSVPIPDIREK